MYSETTKNITVEVCPEFLEQESAPEIPMFLYKYTVTVKNESSHTIQLVDRHWIITDGKGQVQHVEGPGVVGEQPFIKPGESYTYDSGCPLTTKTGNMRGSYGIQTVNESFRVQIPLFFLRMN